MRDILLSSIIVSAALAASISMPEVHASGEAVIGQPFNLGVNQTASIEPEGIGVTFVSVTEDSRCPSDVECIWAGRVSIAVEISSSSDDSHLELTLGGGQSSAKTFGNYSIMLVNVQPYPVSTEEISPSDYVATLVVDSSGAQVVSHGVRVKAKASDGPVAAAIAGWNVEKGKGAAVLFLNGDVQKRVIVRFAPSYSDMCSHGPDPAECIDGQITSTGNGGLAGDEGNFHAEIDSSATQLFLTFAGGEETALNITKFKQWIRPIAIGGNASIVNLKEGQRDGPLLVQEIYPDRIEGLNFPEYPIATDKGLPITLRIGEKASNGCTVTLTLVKIEGAVAMFLKTVDEERICPICWHQQLLSG